MFSGDSCLRWTTSFIKHRKPVFCPSLELVNLAKGYNPNFSSEEMPWTDSAHTQLQPFT
jgi:hypothetical protein